MALGIQKRIKQSPESPEVYSQLEKQLNSKKKNVMGITTGSISLENSLAEPKKVIYHNPEI